MTSRIRLYLACVLFSAWMILLLTGFVLGGWTHLLLAAALAVFPWRAAAGRDAGRGTPDRDDDQPV